VLAKVLHPDKPTGDTARLQAIGVAHETLVSAQQRQLYNASGLLLAGYYRVAC
jgi:curved DNA-binding protein CbpA